MSIRARIEQVRKKHEEAILEGKTSAYVYYAGLLAGLTEAVEMIAEEKTPVGFVAEFSPKEKEMLDKYIEKKKEIVLTLADKCYTARKHLGLSQEAFAHYIGLAQPTIVRVEKGKPVRLPTRQAIERKYAEVFGCQE